MHRHVPCSPEGVDVIRVPPVAVEISVGEVQQLAHQIQERMEHQVEEAQPDQMIRYLRTQNEHELVGNAILNGKEETSVSYSLFASMKRFVHRAKKRVANGYAGQYFTPFNHEPLSGGLRINPTRIRVPRYSVPAGYGRSCNFA